MRRFNRGTALAGAVLVCGAASLALAQKPPALGEPSGPQGGKPQALQPGPAPTPSRPSPPPQAAPRPAPAPQAAPQPPPGSDKFGQAQPVTPPAPEPQQADKFGAPQPPAQAAPAPAPQPPAQASPAPRLPPATPAPPSLATPAPPPADEPDAVRRFRQLLGTDARLSYAAAELIDPGRGSVRLREVVLQRPDRRAAIAELTLDGLRENGIVEALLRGVLLQEGTQGGPADEVRIERVRIAGLTVVRPPPGQQLQPDAITLDALRIEGLRAQGSTPVAIASLSIEDYGKGRPGRIALEGLEVSTPNQDPIDRVSLGRLTLRGIDLASTFAALVAKQPPPRTVGSAAVEAEELVLSKGSQRVAGMASMTLSGEAPPPGQPGAETGRLALRGISVQPFPGAAEWMQRFGYRELVADVTMDASIDRATQRMEIATFSLAARDMGALGFSLTLDGINAGETDPAALARARLVAMRVRFVDQSLYGRFVRMQAQEQRRSEQQVREEFAAQAASIFERPGGARPGPGGKGSGGAGSTSASAEIGAAVQRFLRGQAREIEITARPPQPIPFEQLQSVAPAGPDALQQALGLTVTTR